MRFTNLLVNGNLLNDVLNGLQQIKIRYFPPLNTKK